MQDEKVILHSKKGCIACNRVVYLLGKLDIPHEVVYNNDEGSDVTKFPTLEFKGVMYKNPISVADLYEIKKSFDNLDESTDD